MLHHSELAYFLMSFKLIYVYHFSGKAEFVKALLEHGADVHYTDKEGRSLLMVAVNHALNSNISQNLLC